MDNMLEILKECRLFNGIGTNEIESVLSCLSAGEKEFEKNATVLLAGTAVTRIGIVLSGSVAVVKDDFWGNRTIIGKMEAGEMFAEAFPFAETFSLPFSVISAETSSVLFIDYRKLITTCSSACVYHTRLIGNMLGILAHKNVMLAQKMEHITCRTTREKLLSYLSARAVRSKSSTFTIPFNRQELADFLSVDRSAMSTELGKLRDEGALDFRKNRFRLSQTTPHH